MVMEEPLEVEELVVDCSCHRRQVGAVEGFSDENFKEEDEEGDEQSQ